MNTLLRLAGAAFLAAATYTAWRAAEALQIAAVAIDRLARTAEALPAQLDATLHREMEHVRADLKAAAGAVTIETNRRADRIEGELTRALTATTTEMGNLVLDARTVLGHAASITSQADEAAKQSRLIWACEENPICLPMRLHDTVQRGFYAADAIAKAAPGITKASAEVADSAAVVAKSVEAAAPGTAAAVESAAKSTDKIAKGLASPWRWLAGVGASIAGALLF